MDTAVAPEDTAVVEQAPPPIEATETAETPAATETEPIAATETESSAPAAPDVASLLSSMREDELESLDPIKGLLARKQESARQKAENETARKIAQERQQWLQQGEYAADLESVLRSAVEMDDLGNPRVNLSRQNIESFVDKLWGASVHGTLNATLSVIEGSLPAGVQMQAEDIRQLQELYGETVKNPAKGADLLKAELSVLRKAWIAEERTSLRKEIEAELRKEAAAQQKSAAIRDADEAQTETPTPTRGIGSQGAPRSFESLAEADAAFNAGEIDMNTYKNERKRFGRKD